jgi:hypothetical protein
LNWCSQAKVRSTTPAVRAEAGAVSGLAAGDLGCDPAGSDEAAVLVVVVATVGAHDLAVARAADEAADWWHPLDQRDQLGDVVAVAARERPGERDPRCVYEQVVLGAVSGSINRARARRGTPFSACT